MSPTNPARVTLAITGASGAQYGLRLLECLVAAEQQVFVLVSRAAKVVLATEMALEVGDTPEAIEQFFINRYRAAPRQIRVFGEDDWMSPVASGSGAPGSMVICPCSTGTLSAIACGLSNNLTQRAATVVLKERRKLVIVPREAPYSDIHLENMLKLSRMGSVILPASPGFYHRPESVGDLIDFIVARILDQLGINQELMPSWGNHCL
ncbi:flavin prenyltransferase UbiX [Endozoicomonas sp. SCSIO W0465]|uniref:flavin prenyltransferase UbiX n=1 Tax=Endozoicomonas sp. SCSIO W0465 TaxID=2918516 RepID=UPI0020759304|nr:flavin prenyltransferase UbiX [Endozoicomonas sp. SCSIO W0465]USE39603.1 UbiX family flavin prenyltransferase [Endozoicomonas sp. SCSIO W0465]